MSYADDQMDAEIYSQFDPLVKDCISCLHITAANDFACRKCVAHSNWK